MPPQSERCIQNHPGWYVGNEKPGEFPSLSAVKKNKSLIFRLRDHEPSVMPTAGGGGGNRLQPSQLQQHHNHLQQQQQQGLPPPQLHVDSMTNIGNGRFASSLNFREGLDTNISNVWSFQHQSVPLYRRQPQSSVLTAVQENVNLTPVHCILDDVVDKSTSGTSGAFAGYARAAVSIGLQRDVTPALPMNLQQRDILSQSSLNEQRELQSQLSTGLHQREGTQIPFDLLQRDMSTQTPVGLPQRDAAAPLSIFYPSHLQNQQQPQQVDSFVQPQQVDSFVPQQQQQIQQQHTHVHQQQPHVHHQQQQHIGAKFGKTNGHDENPGDGLLPSTQRQNGGGTTYASVLRAAPQKPNSSASPNGQKEEKNRMGDPFAVLRALGTKRIQETSGLYHYFS
jgi:hypothetical protein